MTNHHLKKTGTEKSQRTTRKETSKMRIKKNRLPNLAACFFFKKIKFAIS